jgi:HEAT repeat protein
LVFGICFLVVTSAAAAKEDVIDSLIFHDPELPKPKIMRVFPKNLEAPWLVALGRPEADFQCQAALTITLAHKDGVSGLEVAVEPLLNVLEHTDHRFARLAAARALVELDARQVARQLFEQAKGGDQRMRDIIEPALARWDYRPAREVWLGRLRRPDTTHADLLLAIGCLEQVREVEATSGLAEIVHSVEASWPTRLKAAHALGVIKTAGSEADARRLLTSGAGRRTEFIPFGSANERNEFRSANPSSSAAANRRLASAWLLRHHSGDDAVHLLQDLAGDAEPAVASIALERLLEIDSKLVPLTALESALASSDAKVRSLGIEVLFKEATAERVSLLADKLNDEHPDVRIKARRLLYDLARSKTEGGKGKWREAVIQQGMRVLAGEDWRGLEQASIFLVQLDHKPAATRLVQLLTFQRPEVLVAAGWGLRRLAVPETLPAAARQFQVVYELTQDRRKGAVNESLPVADWDPQLAQFIAAWDPQLSQLAQFIGQSRYRSAESILRAQVPRHRKPTDAPVIGQESRAACIWALGLFYEGKTEPKLAREFEERLNDAPRMMDPGDFPLVREMCAVALGRMKSRESLNSLRRWHAPTVPAIERLSPSCGWAIREITGEPLPQPTTVILPAGTFRNFLRTLPPGL